MREWFEGTWFFGFVQFSADIFAILVVSVLTLAFWAGIAVSSLLCIDWVIGVFKSKM